MDKRIMLLTALTPWNCWNNINMGPIIVRLIIFGRNMSIHEATSSLSSDMKSSPWRDGWSLIITSRFWMASARMLIHSACRRGSVEGKRRRRIRALRQSASRPAPASHLGEYGSFQRPRPRRIQGAICIRKGRRKLQSFSMNREPYVYTK